MISGEPINEVVLIPNKSHNVCGIPMLSALNGPTLLIFVNAAVIKAERTKTVHPIVCILERLIFVLSSISNPDNFHVTPAPTKMIKTKKRTRLMSHASSLRLDGLSIPTAMTAIGKRITTSVCHHLQLDSAGRTLDAIVMKHLQI